MLKIQTDKILQAEMDRKAFLKNAGIAFAGIIGVTTLVKNINGLAGNQTQRKTTNSAFGYGASPYGGGSVTAKR